MDFFSDFFGMEGGIALFYGIYLLIVWAFGIASYVLRALGMYTIAKRRGIHHPWMSWIPVVDLWVLGCISDQFRYVVKGQTKNRRKWLLVLNIVLTVVYIAFFVLFGVMMVTVISGLISGMKENLLVETMMGSMLGTLACIIPMTVLAITVAVIRYMSMYDLYTSCSPGNNVLFLVLSIFFNVTEPFFVFFIRHKDEGMPPRRPEPEAIPRGNPTQWENV